MGDPKNIEKRPNAIPLPSDGQWPAASAPVQNLTDGEPGVGEPELLSVSSSRWLLTNLPTLPLTPGQHRLFSWEPLGFSFLRWMKKDENEVPPQGFSPTLLDRILTRFPEGSAAQLLGSSPASTAVTLMQKPDGSMEIANHYFEMVQEGVQGARELRTVLESLSKESDPKKFRELLGQAIRNNEIYGKAARAVLDTHTRNGRSEYQTIENWVSTLYQERRSRSTVPPPPLSPATSGEADPVFLQGVLLGFDLTAINKIDQNYKEGTGTVVKYLLEQAAQEIAPKFKGKFLGIWGTNVVVEQIRPDDLEPFRKAVQKRILRYLARPVLPEAVARRVYGMDGELWMNSGKHKVKAPPFHTAKLKARNTLLWRPKGLGLKAGWYGENCDVNSLQPGEIELRVLNILEHMYEAEAEARRTEKPFFIGDLPEESPIRGRLGKSLLRAQPILSGPPHETLPIQPDEFQAELSPHAIREGELPNPIREGSAPKHYYEDIRDGLESMKQLAANHAVKEMHAVAEGLLEYLDHPPSHRKTDLHGIGMEESLQKTFEASLQQHRFPGVHRLEFFPELARRTFAGEKFYLQMFEYKDYWGHNRGNPPDARDSLHRLTLDIQMEGYRYQGVEVITATNGGDEILHAIRGRTLEGEDLTSTDIQRISGYLADNFNRIFMAVDHHQTVKVPRAQAAGIFIDSKNRARPYVVIGKKIYMEELISTRGDWHQLVDDLYSAHHFLDERFKIRLVKKLSDVASIERMRLWQKVSDSGHVVYLFAKEGERPPNAVEVKIPLSTTITPAIEIPAGADDAQMELGLKTVGALADEMKRLGVDRPISGDAAATIGRELSWSESQWVKPILKLSAWHRLADSEWGAKALTTGANGALYLAGEVGSEILLRDFGRKPERYLQAKGAAELALNGAAIFGGAFVGEKAVRLGLRVPLGAQVEPWRNVAARGGGFAVPLVLLSALHSEDGSPDWQAAGMMGLNMAEATAVVRGSAWFSGLAMELVGNAFRAPWLLQFRGLTSRAGWVGLLASATTMVGEFSYLKYRGEEAWQDALQEKIQESTRDVAKAFMEVDQIIAEEINLPSPNKKVRKQENEKFRQAMEKARQQALSHVGILGLKQTEEGKVWQKAANELHLAKKRFEKESKDWEKREKAFETQYFISSPGIGTPSPKRRYESAQECLKAAEAVEKRARKVFEDKLDSIKKTFSSGNPSVPVFFRTHVLPKVQLYQKEISTDIGAFSRQWKNFNESREALIPENISSK